MGGHSISEEEIQRLERESAEPVTANPAKWVGTAVTFTGFSLEGSPLGEDSTKAFICFDLPDRRVFFEATDHNVVLDYYEVPKT